MASEVTMVHFGKKKNPVHIPPPNQKGPSASQASAGTKRKNSTTDKRKQKTGEEKRLRAGESSSFLSVWPEIDAKGTAKKRFFKKTSCRPPRPSSNPPRRAQTKASPAFRRVGAGANGGGGGRTGDSRPPPACTAFMPSVKPKGKVG